MAGILERMIGKKEGLGMRDRNAYKDAVGASIDASEDEPVTERSNQGVTTGPKGPGSSKAGFIAEQLRKGKDEATAKRMAEQIFGR